MTETENINDIKNYIIDRLLTAVDGVSVVNEFNNNDIFHARKKPVITVYLKGIDIKNGAMNNYLSSVVENEQVDTYVKRAVISIGIKIMCTQVSGNLSCDDIFTKLSNVILFDDMLDISSMRCLTNDYNRNFEAFTLDAEITTEKLIASNVLSPVVKSFNLDVSALKKGSE